MALALAVVLQAKQDIHTGGKIARGILNTKTSAKGLRRAAAALAECEAENAVNFFDSPLWWTLCKAALPGYIQFPPDMVSDMDSIRQAIKKIKGRKRKAG